MIQNLANPIGSYRAAPFLAQLVACGLIGRAEALSALLQGVASAQISPNGRQARLTHLLVAVDASPTTNHGRITAAKMAREAIKPLLAVGASKRSLAAAASRSAGQALRSEEIEQLITEAVAQHLRIQRQKSRQHPIGHGEGATHSARKNGLSSPICGELA